MPPSGSGVRARERTCRSVEAEEVRCSISYAFPGLASLAIPVRPWRARAPAPAPLQRAAWRIFGRLIGVLAGRVPRTQWTTASRIIPSPQELTPEKISARSGRARPALLRRRDSCAPWGNRGRERWYQGFRLYETPRPPTLLPYRRLLKDGDAIILVAESLSAGDLCVSRFPRRAPPIV